MAKTPTEEQKKKKKIKEAVVVDFLSHLNKADEQYLLDDLPIFDIMNELESSNDDAVPLERTLIPAYEAFIGTLEDDAIGFISVTFKEDGMPTLIHGGELDLIDCLGAIEVLKHNLLSQPKERFIAYDYNFQDD